jgi:hypothetical protein
LAAEDTAMKKFAYFASRDFDGWPEAREIEPYFLAPPGKTWFFETRNDSGGLSAEGVDGTEHLPRNGGRVDLSLQMWGNRDHGVLLIYTKWGGGVQQMYSSKGDLGRLREWVRTTHGTPLPVGLYIPFEVAWKAVKEFIDTDGALPKSIEWIANRDLPPDTFPEP